MSEHEKLWNNLISVCWRWSDSQQLVSLAWIGSGMTHPCQLCLTDIKIRLAVPLRLTNVLVSARTEAEKPFPPIMFVHFGWCSPHPRSHPAPDPSGDIMRWKCGSLPVVTSCPWYSEYTHTCHSLFNSQQSYFVAFTEPANDRCSWLQFTNMLWENETILVQRLITGFLC